jgi:hypothetical protein
VSELTCGVTSSSEVNHRAQNLTAAETGEVGGVYILREEHAGERGGSLARTDAAQIRRNVGDGPFERRPSTTRTRELKRPE